MDAVIQRINKPQSDVPAQSTTARFNSIENDLKEIKAALHINAMTPRPMTYAQAAAPSSVRTPGPPQNLEAAKRERMEKIKREREKLHRSHPYNTQCQRANAKESGRNVRSRGDTRVPKSNPGCRHRAHQNTQREKSSEPQNYLAVLN